MDLSFALILEREGNLHGSLSKPHFEGIGYFAMVLSLSVVSLCGAVPELSGR